ncbi:MAG: hypothetical protein H0V50_07135, partial [Thermoleophilaceae bacterium]|nr:hypothetical protein [Thermoleophilaceae bacterium]
TAAVIGRNFDVDVLARAAGTPEDDIVDVLDAASRAALVFELADEPGQYGFSHALVQHMLYDDLGLSRRARTHLKVAEAIEGLSGTRSDSRNGELARHWANAPQPANLAKAVEASRRAADAALSALAPADALRHYSHAVDLLARSAEPDPLLAIDLNVGLGTAQRQTGDPAYRATLLGASRQAADRADAGRLASAALAYSQANLFSDGAKFDVERVQTLELALDHLSSHDPRRARLLATLCTELTYVSPLSRRQALADEAVAVAEAAGDDATIVWVLNHVLYSLRVPQLFARSLASSADALTRAERIDDPVLVFWSAQLRAGVAACAGDIVEMDRCLAIVALLAERLAQPTLTWIHLFVSAERAQIAGDGELTAQLARAARQVGRDIYEPEADLFYSSQIGAVSFQQGRFGRLIPVLEETSSDVPLMAEVIASLLALAHVEAGQLDEAGRLLARFAATGFELPLAPTWLTVMVHYAEVAFVCRDRRNGAPLLDRLAPFGEQVSNGGLKSEGPVIHYLGGLATVLGSFDRADIYFAQAAAMNERMKAKFFAARTNLWWGQMLAERNGSGDAERARALLAEARVCAATNGYVNVERRAASALDQMV